MKKQLKINQVTEKETSIGKTMWTIETDGGKFNVFDKDLAKNLMESSGETVEVELTQNGKYLNITAFMGIIDRPASSSDERLKSMCVSYAKDLISAEITALVTKTDSLTDAKVVVNSCEERLETVAKSLYKMILDLDKIKGA